MAAPQAQTTYKKQNGILAISKDRKAVSWSPAQPPDASPSLVISATNITNLQQTPESSAKVMLKVFTQETGQSEPVAHVFTFISKNDPRLQANAIKDALASAIQAQKAAQFESASMSGQSAAMAIATAVMKGSGSGNVWEDDDKLKADFRLQQSLMKEDPILQKTFMEALSMKPESISTTQFTSQFWSSRVHQLRAHAIAQSQGRGRYNVFSELKKEDGGRKMNLTSDHVRVIFEQYPIMQTVYNEIVPNRIKDETEFWSRFFQSQLYMALRGLKFDRSKDAKDSVLDKYLDHPELSGARLTSSELHIPKFIDLEGNEENHSQRKGNRPDADLRVSALDKAPIIRRLNALSEKIMSTVRPSDIDASAPIGMDEATYQQLRLRDLAGDPEQNRIILNIRDQSRFFANNRASANDETDSIRKIDPSKAIRKVCKELATTFPQPGARTLPIDDYESAPEDDADDDDEQPSGGALATKHILELVNANRNQTAQIPQSSGLSTGIYDRVTLTHATTLEFQRQFWNAFLSGDAARATEVISLAESLNKALERIDSIAKDAEAERNEITKAREQKAIEYYKKFGKKVKVDYSAIGGGGEVVKHLLAPMIKSVKTALRQYNAAYQQQMQELKDAGEDV